MTTMHDAERAVGHATALRDEAPPDAAASGDAIRVAVVGASGFVGGELIRLLERHPRVRIVALVARDRDREAISRTHPHLATTRRVLDARIDGDVDAVFLALPHGAAAEQVPALAADGTVVIDLGPDFRLRDPADYPRWYGYDHPSPALAETAVYGLPELHRDELRALAGSQVRIVGSPGCYPTASVLAVAPLARAELIGDIVIDAKSGVSGAGREPKLDLTFSAVNENVRAYGLGGHRHIAEIEQELRTLGGAEANPGAHGVDFVPHLVPMTRGILATAHVQPTRALSQSDLDELYAEMYDDEPFVEVVRDAPDTKSVLGSNFCRVHVRHDARTGRVLALAVIDNLVKGAAGQAIQAFNVVHGLPESTGLEQLPIFP